MHAPWCTGALPSQALAPLSATLQRLDLNLRSLNGACASLAEHLAGSLLHLDLKVRVPKVLGLHVPATERWGLPSSPEAGGTMGHVIPRGFTALCDILCGFTARCLIVHDRW